MSATGTSASKVFTKGLRVDVRPASPSSDRATPAPSVPLLVCSGIGARLEVMQPLVDALDPRLKVVRFDAPGVGGSRASLMPYPMLTLAHRVLSILADLSISRVDVLGYSWGGLLCQQLALQYPHRVRRVVLMNTATGILSIPAKPTVTLRMMSPHLFRGAHFKTSELRALYGGLAPQRGDDIRELFAHDLNTGGIGFLHQFLAAGYWTSLPLLPILRQRTLIVAGKGDPIVPVANGRLMQRLIPNATLHEYTGGHVDPLLDPASFGPVINEFLTRR